MQRKTIDRLFMILFGVVGLCLFVIMSNNIKNISKKCTSNFIRDGLMIVMVLAGSMLTLAMSYGFCAFKGNCYGENEQTDTTEFYLTISATLSGFLIALLSSIRHQLDGVCIGDYVGASKQETTNGKDLKFAVTFALSICVVTFGISLAGIWYNTYYIPIKFRRMVEKTTAPETIRPSFLGARGFQPL